MKKHKLFSLILSLTIGINSLSVLPVTASTDTKIDEDVYTAIDNGDELIDIKIIFDIISYFEYVELADTAEEEYKASLDTTLYTEEEIEDMAYKYRMAYIEELISDSKQECLNATLTTLQLEQENITLDEDGDYIICTLTPEQILLTDSIEEISHVYLKPFIIPHTVDALVAEDTDFANNEFVYSDKYQFAMEHNDYGDYLVVYGIPYDDTFGDWKEHIIFNPDYVLAGDVPVQPEPGRDIYSGYNYQVGMFKKNYTTEGSLHFIFYILDEIPYWSSSVIEANSIGFDTGKYIFPDTEHGDIDEDGEITVADAVNVMAYAANPDLSLLTDKQLYAADVYQQGDGVGVNDAAAIQKYLTKQIETLPESGL